MKRLIFSAFLIMASFNAFAFSFGSHDCVYYLDNGKDEIDQVNTWLSGFYVSKIGRTANEKGYYKFLNKAYTICQNSISMTIFDAANTAFMIVESENK